MFLQKQMSKYCTKKCVENCPNHKGKKIWNNIYFGGKTQWKRLRSSLDSMQSE